MHTVESFRTGHITHGRALLVLDHDRRILLRASGLWETYGEVEAVCSAAKVNIPSHLGPSYSSQGSGRGGKSRSTRRAPTFDKAPGYRRLRTQPRG